MREELQREDDRRDAGAEAEAAQQAVEEYEEEEHGENGDDGAGAGVKVAG